MKDIRCGKPLASREDPPRYEARDGISGNHPEDKKLCDAIRSSILLRAPEGGLHKMRKFFLGN